MQNQTTLITAFADEDFWTILHQPGKAQILEFLYGDSGESKNSAALTRECAKFFGCEIQNTRSFSPTFELEDSQWSIRSPQGRIYKGDTETECLRKLLTAEPDAILEMAPPTRTNRAAKILTTYEILEALTRVANDCDQPQHEALTNALAKVLCEHAGGTHSPAHTDDDLGLNTSVAFYWDENVPENGGVFARYDTDVPFKDWKANQPKQEKTTKTQAAFIRNDAGTIDRLVVVEFTHPQEVTNPIAAFEAAITEWVETTESGREEREGSSQDLNIGDVLGIIDPKLEELLVKHGILRVETRFELDQTNEVNYDRILASPKN